jgi:hypothetical protein
MEKRASSFLPPPSFNECTPTVKMDGPKKRKDAKPEEEEAAG